MCVGLDFDIVRARLRTLKRISLVLGVLLVMVASIFFWTGFSVPDWLELKMSQVAVEKKFGLWLVCSINARGSVLTCKYWISSSELFPDFLKTTQVLVTLGCILGTFSLGFGVAAMFLKSGNQKISIQLAASLTSLIAALFFTISLAAFGGDFSSYAVNLGAVAYSRRWGYWMLVPAVILLVPASFFLIIDVFAAICIHRNDDELSNMHHRKNHQMLNSNNRMMSPRPGTPLSSTMSGIIDTRSIINGESSGNSDSTTTNNMNNSNQQQQRMMSASVFDMNYPGRGNRLTASQQPAVRYGYYPSPSSSSASSSSDNSSIDTSSSGSVVNSAAAAAATTSYNNRYYPYRQATPDYNLNGYRGVVGGYGRRMMGASYGGGELSHMQPIEKGVVEIMQAGMQQNYSNHLSTETGMFWTRVKNLRYFYGR